MATDQTIASAPARRPSPLTVVVPPLIRSGWSRLVEPLEARRIVSTEVPVEGGAPLRAYIHPGTQLGSAILRTGRYEPQTEDLMRRELRPGDVFLDIGANEGFLSALGGLLVGARGLVIAVEPQGRLQSLIEINLRINGIDHFRIFHNALGGRSGALGAINLYPETNSGQSGFIKKPRFGWTALRSYQEPITFISPEEVMGSCGVERIDLAKIDVEGFEHKVVETMLPLIGAGRVKKVLLDYHTAILARQGIDPATIHKSLVDAGMRPAPGQSGTLDSYVLYERSGQG